MRRTGVAAPERRSIVDLPFREKRRVSAQTTPEVAVDFRALFDFAEPGNEAVLDAPSISGTDNEDLLWILPECAVDAGE
jgi:hypothetical protein